MIESLNRLDKSAFLFLNSIHYAWADGFMDVMSGQIIWVPFVVYFIWAMKKKVGNKSAVIFTLLLLMTLAACDVVSSYFLKNIFTRLRPCRVEELKAYIYFFGQKCGGKFSFVSSHAANSLALVVFSLRTIRFNSRLAYLFLILPLVVSYSRIYLGVHYPGDIIGGWIVGLLWAYFFSWVFKNSKVLSEQESIR